MCIVGLFDNFNHFIALTHDEKTVFGVSNANALEVEVFNGISFYFHAVGDQIHLLKELVAQH